MKQPAVFLPLGIALGLYLTGCATPPPAPDPAAALNAAREAQAGGLDTPEEKARYNAAVAETVAWWQTQADKAQPNQPVTIPGTDTTLAGAVPPGTLWDRFIPADSIKARAVKIPVTRPGVGSPQVSFWESDAERVKLQPLLSEIGYVEPLTATLDFPAKDKAVLKFTDPREAETIRVGGRKEALAADFSAPVEVELRKRKGTVSKIGALLNSENYLDKLGLFALEPPRPNAIPVIFVHGLMSKPLTWADMANGLNDDPVIREKYQFYFFRYPTGVPVVYSAKKFRDQLAMLDTELAKVHNQARGRIVLVGHSMGGLVSKGQVTTSGDKIWVGLFGNTPDKLKMKPATKEHLRPYLEYEANPNIDRVVFICTPHRGSKMADIGIVRTLTRALIKLPVSVLDTTLHSVLLDEEQDPALKPLIDKGVPSSVNNLSPESSYVKIFGAIPIDPRVHVHSIVGNQKGLPLDDPRAGDGVVPYTSAHLDGVDSELVVRSNHGAHEKPEAVAEIRRILLLNLKE
jgi:hypothetical protein